MRKLITVAVAIAVATGGAAATADAGVNEEAALKAALADCRGHIAERYWVYGWVTTAGGPRESSFHAYLTADESADPEADGTLVTVDFPAWNRGLQQGDVFHAEVSIVGDGYDGPNVLMGSLDKPEVVGHR
ncbi:hypothetical protein [Nocardia sp. NPDC006630]|uniref:hypothetical protein n=1 Tax=Nocardia sp. NPDC006630 TaxID=3157181 RepID=UPI00339FEE37